MWPLQHYIHRIRAIRPFRQAIRAKFQRLSTLYLNFPEKSLFALRYRSILYGHHEGMAPHIFLSVASPSFYGIIQQAKLCLGGHAIWWRIFIAILKRNFPFFRPQGYANLVFHVEKVCGRCAIFSVYRNGHARFEAGMLIRRKPSLLKGRLYLFEDVQNGIKPPKCLRIIISLDTLCKNF